MSDGDENKTQFDDVSVIVGEIKRIGQNMKAKQLFGDEKKYTNGEYLYNIIQLQEKIGTLLKELSKIADDKKNALYTNDEMDILIDYFHENKKAKVGRREAKQIQKELIRICKNNDKIRGINGIKYKYKQVKCLETAKMKQQDEIREKEMMGFIVDDNINEDEENNINGVLKTTNPIRIAMDISLPNHLKNIARINKKSIDENDDGRDDDLSIDENNDDDSEDEDGNTQIIPFFKDESGDTQMCM